MIYNIKILIKKASSFTIASFLMIGFIIPATNTTYTITQLHDPNYNGDGS